MNQNWIVENLNNAFSTWNGKLTELWGLVTTSPQTFKGGAVWGVMQSLHNAMIGIGYALIVLFFAISLFKNTANFHELKRPEAAVHYLIRFVAAKTLVGYGMDIMLNIFSVCNGIVSDMAAGMGGISQAMVALPGEVQSAIENVGFLASIPLWLVTILGSLFITVLSFVMILTVYGRFFRLYMYTALAPLPLASFAGESTQSVGISFIKSYVGVCLEGAVIVLACVIYAAFVSTPTVSGGEATTMVWSYLTEIIFNIPLGKDSESTMPTPPASRRIFRTIWITPWRMRCFPTASLSLCCGNRKVWKPWNACTGCPSRSWNFCATLARVTALSRWATA